MTSPYDYEANLRDALADAMTPTDVLREAREASAPKPWDDALRETMARRRESRMEEAANDRGRVPEYTAQQLDALERYVFALEEIVGERAAGAPLLRGTWRDRSDAPRRFALREYRCSIRKWKDAAIALRRWMTAQAGE